MSSKICHLHAILQGSFGVWTTSSSSSATNTLDTLRYQQERLQDVSDGKPDALCTLPAGTRYVSYHVCIEGDEPVINTITLR